MVQPRDVSSQLPPAGSFALALARLVGEEQSDGLQALLATVHIVSEEEVVALLKS